MSKSTILRRTPLVQVKTLFAWLVLEARGKKRHCRCQVPEVPQLGFMWLNQEVSAWQLQASSFKIDFWNSETFLLQSWQASLMSLQLFQVVSMEYPQRQLGHLRSSNCNYWVWTLWYGPSLFHLPLQGMRVKGTTAVHNSFHLFPSSVLEYLILLSVPGKMLIIMAASKFISKTMTLECTERLSVWPSILQLVSANASTLTRHASQTQIHWSGFSEAWQFEYSGNDFWLRPGIWISTRGSLYRRGFVVSRLHQPVENRVKKPHDK